MNLVIVPSAKNTNLAVSKNHQPSPMPSYVVLPNTGQMATVVNPNYINSYDTTTNQFVNFVYDPWDDYASWYKPQIVPQLHLYTILQYFWTKSEFHTWLKNNIKHTMLLQKIFEEVWKIGFEDESDREIYEAIYTMPKFQHMSFDHDIKVVESWLEENAGHRYRVNGSHKCHVTFENQDDIMLATLKFGMKVPALVGC